MLHVGIVMGSDSDLASMAESTKALDHFRVQYEMVVVSAHRHPEKAGSTEQLPCVSRRRKWSSKIAACGRSV